jgi:hypothetical protein
MIDFSSSETDHTCIYAPANRLQKRIRGYPSQTVSGWQAATLREQRRAQISMPFGPGKQQYRIAQSAIGGNWRAGTSVRNSFQCAGLDALAAGD